MLVTPLPLPPPCFCAPAPCKTASSPCPRPPPAPTRPFTVAVLVNPPCSNDDVPEDAGEGDECAQVGREAMARLTEALKGEAVLGVAANLVKVLLGLAAQDPANPIPFAGAWGVGPM